MHVINGYHGRFAYFVIMSLARVWHQLWSPVKSLLGSAWTSFCLNIDLTKPTHYFMHIAILGSQILLLLTIACLRHKGIHIPSLCAFYGNVLRKILANKRRHSMSTHRISSEHPICNWTNDRVSTPACGRLETVSPENHFLFINSHTHVSGKTLYS